MDEASRSHLIARTTRVVVAVGVLFVGVVLSALLLMTAPVTEPAGSSPPPPAVLVFEAHPVAVQRQWRGYGTAEAMDSADVPVRVTAVVASIPADVLPGAAVQAGQRLVEMDTSDFERQVEIAEQELADLTAQLAMLELERQRLAGQLALDAQDVATWTAEFERVQALVAQGAGKARDVEVAQRSRNAAERARLQAAESLDGLGPRQTQLLARQQAQRAAVRLAQLNLDRCIIRSPLDGVLEAVDVEVGEHLTSGQRAVRVVNLRTIEVPLHLPAAARQSVAVGDRVDLRPTHHGGAQWSARVARIAPEDDPATRSTTVFLELDQTDALVARWPHAGVLLSPGVFVEGTVTTQSVVQQWVVPRRALRAGRILVVDHGMLRSQAVEVAYTIAGQLGTWGLDDREWAVLEQPLQDGQQVVLNGSTTLRIGQAVRPILAGDEVGDETSDEADAQGSMDSTVDPPEDQP